MSEITGEGFCAVCNKTTERKCAACKNVYYCSEEHQKQNWKLHKISCRAFEICESDVLGKYLKATRDLKPGDIIFIEYPLVFGPKPHFIEEGPVPCPGCCRNISINSTEKCEDCSWPVCSNQCPGLKDPSCHGLECKLLDIKKHGTNVNNHKIVRSDVLMAIRALLLAKLNKSKWAKLIGLESHIERRGPGTEIYKIVEEKANIINKLFPDLPVKTIHEIYGIFDVNATELTEDVEAEILYYNASLMEHNCVPNTCQIIDYNDKYKITVKASLPVKSGEHITAMYTHALWGTQARREHLKKTKYFLCKCTRCEDPTEFGTFFSGFKCLHCDGYFLPVNENEYACNECKITFKNDEVSNMFVPIDAEVDEVLSIGPNVKCLEETLSKLLKVLHPNHYHIYAIKHQLVQMYGNLSGVKDEDLLKKIVLISNELIEITKKLDPAQFSLLQLEITDYSSTDEMNNVLQKAKDILQNELNTNAGSKLYEVIEKNESEFKKWVKENSS